MERDILDFDSAAFKLSIVSLSSGPGVLGILFFPDVGFGLLSLMFYFLFLAALLFGGIFGVGGFLLAQRDLKRLDKISPDPVTERATTKANLAVKLSVIGLMLWPISLLGLGTSVVLHLGR